MIRNEKNSAKGFALVVTLTLMVLLMLLAVGLLSLSSITLRTASQNSAQAEARANARMALQIAIGELQKQLGPDQRISANGAITSTTTVANPHWTGVWDSWIAGDPTHAPTNPNYPSEPSEHRTIGSPTDATLRDAMHPKYDEKDDHFRRWLVSLNSDEAEDIDTARILELEGERMPDKDDEAIQLVGEGSTVDAASYVSAHLIDVSASDSGGTGRFAWWVGDESQKARVMHDSYASSPPANDAARIHRIQAPGSTGTNTITDLEDLTAAQDAKLVGLPSMNTLKLLPEGPLKDPYRKNFHSITSHSSSVLADVREGGLKRDLSVLLERPIDAKGPGDNQEEGGDEFMLYAFDDPRFSDRSHSRVPIQDLAAYYQLYDNQPGFANQRREGVRFTSGQLANSIQISPPDFHGGGSGDRNRILREYTAVYRQPVVAKIQFLLGAIAEEITQQDRDSINAQVAGTIRITGNESIMPVPPDDTHKLILGIMPIVTLWNPNNLPLVMQQRQVLHVMSPPPVIFNWRKYDGAPGSTVDTRPTSISFYTNGEQVWQLDGRDGGSLMVLNVGGVGSAPVVFNPGEVKTFMPTNASGAAFGTLLGDAGPGTRMVNAHVGNVEFLPDRFFKLWHSSTYLKSNSNPHVFVFSDNAGKNRQSVLVFNENDRFSLRIDHERAPNSYSDPHSVSCRSFIRGAAFGFSLTDPRYYSDWQYGRFLTHSTLLSRHGGSDQNTRRPVQHRMAVFNEELISPGFSGSILPIEPDGWEDAIKVSDLIDDDGIKGLFEFSLSLGVETGPVAGGFGGGRRIAIRPFLHSTAGAPPFMDRSEKEWLYNYGWNWQMGRINDVDNSIVQADPGTDNGFFGGGYTIGDGTTHVVQREIPVLPPISLASLSHAQLGGYSLAYAVNYHDIDPATGTIAEKGSRISGEPFGTDFQMTTATGQGGLEPKVQQAIGNSYAHPNLLPTEAFTVKTRRFDEDDRDVVGEGDVEGIPFVDHSYLANKALWDDYFFSSLSPQPGNNPLFGGSGRNALEVAQAFFFNNEPLPNRRIKPHTDNIDPDKLANLFTQANDYTDGLADKIAAYLMVDGAFNINSTSVEAWKVLLSSLQGKPVAYLDGGVSPKVATTDADNTPMGTGILPRAAPILTADIIGPNQPPEQWLTGRVLIEDEIDELANAIVNQVKLRGPFLSLSEFINRRLDDHSAAEPYALKGALQAALDDPSVAINASFRSPRRILDDETSAITFAFPAAATGPIAYGSMPYVDQADVLQHFAEQLSPRGDTFIVRSYGDALDPSGKVIARAWCEAVVQRAPEYSDPSNEPHEKQATLTPANRDFGRKMKIISFRWLHPEEV